MVWKVNSYLCQVTWSARIGIGKMINILRFGLLSNFHIICQSTRFTISPLTADAPSLLTTDTWVFEGDRGAATGGRAWVVGGSTLLCRVSLPPRGRTSGAMYLLSGALVRAGRTGSSGLEWTVTVAGDLLEPTAVDLGGGVGDGSRLKEREDEQISMGLKQKTILTQLLRI